MNTEATTSPPVAFAGASAVPEKASAAQGAAPVPVRRTTVFLLTATFAMTLGHPLVLGGLPLKVLLKDKLGVSPAGIAVFFGLAALAFYVKPLLGLLLDLAPRRFPMGAVLLLSSAVAAVCWALIGVLPPGYGSLLVLFGIATLGMTMAANVLGGVLIHQGQRLAATGRLNAAKMAARHGGYLIAGPLGGYLAARPLGHAATAGVALLVVLWVAAFLNRGALVRMPDPAGASSARQAFRSLFRSRPLWVAALMILLVDIAPGFDTPLFYFQTNALGFTPEFIGWLQLIAGTAGLGGALVYGVACRRVSPLPLLMSATAFHAAATLLYLAYRSAPGAAAITFAGGLGATLAALPVLDLASRAAPRAVACGAFAAMMAVRMISAAASDVLGSYLNSALGVTFHQLVWINAVSTLLVLAAIPAIPRLLSLCRDGEYGNGKPPAGSA